jgi:hypothetical protein
MKSLYAAIIAHWRRRKHLRAVARYHRRLAQMEKRR